MTAGKSIKNCWRVKNLDTVGYYAHDGHKYIHGERVKHGSSAEEGSKIEMTIDMHEDKESVSYKVNGVSSGIAFSGLGDWGDEIYIIMGIY